MIVLLLYTGFSMCAASVSDNNKTQRDEGKIDLKCIWNDFFPCLGIEFSLQKNLLDLNPQPGEEKYKVWGPL